jgi:ABC-type branched-subunit amino acid transport system ATPase component
MNSRQSIIELVGPPGAGKTTLEPIRKTPGNILGRVLSEILVEQE